ncbi:MAG TPA: DnaJ C-terminal domain-containing protein [Verrucomicrobiae bacterium]|jgi:curved DNA-binding protein|nr:DnaJ C-terminal domain-containing protein [Verrucomicrobiae bacterium]
MPVEFKDYYKTLGVSREASQDEIRKAFRKLAREFHPDVAKDKKRAEEKFKEINEAYEVLSDPAKRKKYDTLGANWNRPQSPPGWEQGGGGGLRGQAGPNGQEYEFHFGGTGFSDFFEQFFGGRGGQGFDFEEFARQQSRGTEAGAARGKDIEGDIMVALNEALQGSVRTISFRRQNRQTGKAVSENFRVRIPVGVHEGQLIRVPGKGEEGFNGGAPGDLYLRVRFEQHPDFRVRGSDLFYDLDLAPWEAVLGTTVSIPALEGPVSVRVPAGAGKGQQLRVRGKGLPAAGGARGDLYATISIHVPAEVTPEEERLWQELAEKSAFNPRK